MQIIALGGGGFLMEPENPLLDRYLLAQTGRDCPRVCFLPQASGEWPGSIELFHETFNELGATPSWLSLFKPHTADIEGYLCEQDLIFVGGGNTKSMLALWREWGLDTLLRKAGEGGTILSGISAGAICWFEACTTDSIPGRLTSLRGLGYLPGSLSPHYDGEGERRPTMQRMVASGELPPGLALDDGAAVHFRDGEMLRIVTSRPKAQGYRLEREGEHAVETVLPVEYLGNSRTWPR